MAMALPKRLSTQDFPRVETMLHDFYRLRPTEYHIDRVAEQDLEEYVQFVERFVKPPADLLEFGAGSWRLPTTLQRHGYDVVGCDLFSDEDLRRFSQKLPSQGAVLKAYDGRQLPFGDTMFDVVSSRNVFEHLLHVEQALLELDRVLKPGGIFIIACPNWSGPNNAIRALEQMIFKKKQRYWLYDSKRAALIGLFRSLKWYLEVKFSSQVNFIHIHPRTAANRIDFEYSDDDVVHLCQPLSLYKWFQQHHYAVVTYNNAKTESTLGNWLNPLFPSFATTNRLVFRKPCIAGANG